MDLEWEGEPDGWFWYTDFNIEADLILNSLVGTDRQQRLQQCMCQSFSSKNAWQKPGPQWWMQQK